MNQLTKEYILKNNISFAQKSPPTPLIGQDEAYDYNAINTYDVVLTVPHDGQTRFWGHKEHFKGYIFVVVWIYGTYMVIWF